MSLIKDTPLPIWKPPVWPFLVEHSAMFDGVDDYLTRTPASGGNRRTWTCSTWFKHAKLGTQIALFSASPSTNASEWLYVNHLGGVALLAHRGSPTSSYRHHVLPRLTDQTAHYHLVVVFDTTQTDETQRVRIYINGEPGQPDTANNAGHYWPLNDESYVNHTVPHTLCRYPGSAYTYYAGGYLAETILVDGQALTPDAFGEFSSQVDGLWMPKAYTGTYGTNGFKLDFGNGAALGADVSDEGNDWTVAGAPTQTLDTPTSNYCTLSPYHRWRIGTGEPVFSNGNNTVSLPTAAQYALSFGTFALPTSGKWYWEQTMHDIYGTGGIHNEAGEYARFEGTVIYMHNASQTGLPAIAAGDVMAVCFDADADTVQFRRNGVDHGTPVGLSLWGTPLFPMAGDWHASQATASTTSFAATGLAHVPPEGFSPLSAATIPNGVILAGSYPGNGTANGPFVNTNCALDTLTIGANTYTNDGTANAVVQFFANGFKLVSATDNANATTYPWTGTLKYPFNTSNAQTN